MEYLGELYTTLEISIGHRRRRSHGPGLRRTLKPLRPWLASPPKAACTIRSLRSRSRVSVLISRHRYESIFTHRASHGNLLMASQVRDRGQPDPCPSRWL